jgi:CheY-like chemotaxis protein
MATLIQTGISIKAIALSGFGMEEDVRRSKEVGFAEHLTKPISFQKLQTIIERLISS